MRQSSGRTIIFAPDRAAARTSLVIFRLLVPKRIARNPDWRIDIGEAFREGRDIGRVNGGVWQRIIQTTHILEGDGQSLLVRFISVGFFGVGKPEWLANLRDSDENI